MIAECSKHGVAKHNIHRDGKYRRVRCARCASDAVDKRRRTMRQRLVTEVGGKCIKCGYSKCLRALNFHHRDPKEKLFPLSMKTTLAWARLLEEAKKCDLLCANCHMELHDEERGAR